MGSPTYERGRKGTTPKPSDRLSSLRKALDRDVMIHNTAYGSIRQKLGNLLLHGYFLFISRKTSERGRPAPAQGSMETQRWPMESGEQHPAGSAFSQI